MVEDYWRITCRVPQYSTSSLWRPGYKLVESEPRSGYKDRGTEINIREALDQLELVGDLAAGTGDLLLCGLELRG
jgi:hypothetical protein